MGIGEIIALVLLGILGLFVIISALIGLGRGLKKTLGSTVVIILSVIIALLLTTLVFRPIILKSGVITESIAGMIQGSDIADILEITAVADALSSYIYMIVAPFIFVLLFVLIRIILGITMRIVMKFIPILNNLPPVAKRLGGLGVGAVNGFILCLVLFMPLLGTVNLVNTVVSSIDIPAENAEESVEAGSVIMISSEQTSETDEISQYISSAVDSGAGKVLLSCGGEFMYNLTASVNCNGEWTNLSKEADVIVTMVNDITAAGEDDIAKIIDAVVECVGASPIIKNFAADFLSEAAQAWVNGETFMGMEKISVEEEFEPMIDATLEILATEDEEYICDDLEAISAFIHKVEAIGLLDNMEDMDSIEAGTFAELIGSIENNDRMLPLIDGVHALSIKIFATGFGIMNDKQELYDDLMKSLAETINQCNNDMIPRDEAKVALIEVLQDHGIDVESEEIDNGVSDLLYQYYGFYEVMPEDISAFFEENLFSAETMETVVITSDEIIDKLVSYKDIADRHTESENIDEVVVSLMNIEINSDMKVSNVLDKMGEILDKMHKTSVYGEATKDLLVAIMQADKVSGSFGLNVLEITDFANNINNGVTEGTKYSNIATTVSKSINMLEKINGGETSQEVIQELMKDLTPETAKVMQNVTTPSLMKTYGVGEENAEKSSNAVSSLFGNMANYTTNHPQGDMSDDEYKASIQKESEAVEKIIAVSIKATEDKEESKALFTTGGEDGSLDLSASEVVDLFVKSTVATDTVEDLVNGDNGSFDPLGIENKMTDSDKNQMTDALDDYKKNNSDVEDEVLANIGAMFGVVYGAN